MLTISVTELVALLVLLPLFGGLVGYVVAGDRMRRAAGGKTPAELREELDDYRAGVTAHFQQTADLLGGMTEQYRAVYKHMAKGATELCESVEPGPRLEQLRSQLLEVEAGVDAETGEDVTQPRHADGSDSDVPAAGPTIAAVGGAPTASNRSAA